MAKKREKAKTKLETFKKFSVWRNLPIQLLGKQREELEKAGIDDPMYQELIVIRNRAEFARRFKVSQKTLSFWSKEIPTLEADKKMHQFYSRFTKEILMAFIREQLRHPTPQGLITWYSIVKGKGMSLF